MKIVSYNIQYCKGQDDRIDPDRIASEIQGADVMALQEVDRHWPRTGNVDQVAEIRKHFPHQGDTVVTLRNISIELFLIHSFYLKKTVI